MSKKKTNTPVTVPTFTMEDTTNPNIKRYCDMNGDWTHYFLVKEKKFVKAVNHILDLGHSKGPNFKQFLMRMTAEEIEKKLLEKGDAGSRTHQAIADLIGGSKVSMATKYATELEDGRQTPLNMDEWKNLEGFINWCEKYNPRVVSYEYTIAGKDYAGTMDALFVITIPAGDKEFDKGYWGKDVLILVDWKTSAQVWVDYEAQTSAYFKAILADKKFKKFVDAYKGALFTGVVRIGTSHKSGYQFVYWTQRQTEGEHWNRFCAAHMIANRYEAEDKVPQSIDVVTEFFIKVPQAKVVATKKRATKKKATPKKKATAKED